MQDQKFRWKRSAASYKPRTHIVLPAGDGEALCRKAAVGAPTTPRFSDSTCMKCKRRWMAIRDAQRDLRAAGQ